MYKFILPVKMLCMVVRFLLLLQLVTVVGCFSNSKVVKYPSGSSDEPYQGVAIDENARMGIASWYGDKEQGNKTASGEVFNRYFFTAAHKTLPFDTMVRVTNLNNGRDVVVKINDRGPYVGDRIIDLSYAAAESIRLIKTGTAMVKVEVLSSPSKKKHNIFKPIYTIQVASFSSKVNAISLKKNLNSLIKESVRVEPIEFKNNTYYRVRVGMFTSKKEAESLNKTLKKYGYKGRVFLE